MTEDPPDTCFYRPTASGFLATAATGGPWRPDAQHGGPPAALLGRALEQLGPGAVGRVTLDLLGPVPVGEVTVTAEVERSGRSVSLRVATMSDPATGRAVARARAWVFPESDAGPGRVGPPLPHGPRDGRPAPPPPTWHRGYLDAVEWSWIAGSSSETGPAVVWMRPRVPLVEGEESSPLQRLLTCVDSVSGVSGALDVADWAFLNTDLTVHVIRPPEGDWVCVDARTDIGPGAVGMATSEVYDERGLVARTAQALLVAPAG